ncbi:MAG: carboxypeptidase regulatory-like domain-containing protein [Armatimonadota bacterium]
MRIFKGFIGWICFLSLFAIPVSVLLWMWAFSWPFLHGATVIRLHDPDRQELETAILAKGVNSSINPILEEFVKKTAVSYPEVTGVEAILTSATGLDPLSLHGGIPSTKGMHSAAAVVVADRENKIVAAYPRTFIGIDYNSASVPYIRKFVPHAAFSHDDPIVSENASQETTYLGRLRIFTNGNLVLEHIDPDQIAPSWLVNISGYKPDRDMSILLVRVIVFLLMFGITLPIWVGLDASWRGMRPFIWGILVLLTSFIGLLAYLIARLPAPRPCSNCGEKVYAKYLRCPNCGVEFLQRCLNCGRKMKPGWQFCPLCKVSGDVQQNNQIADYSITALPITSSKKFDTGALNVTVVDADTCLPLRNAVVAIHGPSELSGQTNGRGLFIMNQLSDGEYDIEISKSGYSTEKQSIYVSSAQNEELSINLRPMPGKVIGRITDYVTGMPVSSVRVYLDTVRIDRSAVTGVDGSYILDDLPYGDYILITEAVGYELFSHLVDVHPGQNMVVDVKLVPVEEEMMIRMNEEITDVVS